MADRPPWEDYTSADGPWSQFGDQALATEPADAGGLAGDIPTIVADMVAKGKSKAEIEAYVASQNGGSTSLKGLDEALAYRDGGGKQPIRVIDGGTIAPPTSVDRSLRLGIGDVAQGVGDVLGVVGNPVNALLNLTGVPQALTGSEFTTDYGQTLRDMVGGPEPLSEFEQYASAINRGGAGGLATAGLGLAAAGAAGTTGRVAAEVGANPIRDFIAGLTGGAGAKAGEEVGGTPGAIVGSIAGGAAGLSGTMIAERLLKQIPEEVLFDASGRLSENGKEIAQRVGADLEEVQQVFARRRDGARSGAVERSRNPQPAPNLDEQTQRIQAAIQQRIAGREAAAETAEQAPPRYPPTSDNAFDRAAGEGVQLTRGQAEQDFGIQNDENSLRVAATREGNEAREFYRRQGEQITAAAERFRSAFGDVADTAADRGTKLKDAIQELRDGGAEGVRQLYRQAEAMGGGGLRLDTAGIREAATDVLIDEAVPEPIKRAVSQELARYGIIGTAEPINEAGLTRVVLDDGSSISFRGPVKDLTAANAEDLRRAVNRLYDAAKPNLSGQSIKPAIDDALEAALVAPATEAEGGIAAAYEAARAAHRTQRQTFNAKDIINSLVANKKGTDTPLLLPERAIAQVIGTGAKGVTNLRTVKNLLTSRPSPASTQAWQAIQQQALADIFGGSLQQNINRGGGEIAETISGAKLRTQVFKTFGVDKLRVLLDDEDFNQLMKLVRVIGDATIPISGTTNPSGTFTKLVNFLGKGALRFTGLGHVGDAALSLANKARDLAATRKTLAGITSYDGQRETGARLDQQARDFFNQYIMDGSAGRLVPKGLNLSATQTGGQE